MERKHFVLPLVFVVFFFVLWPISTEANPSTNNVRVTLIYHDGTKREVESIKRMNGKGIQVVAVGRNMPEIVLCDDLAKILDPQYGTAVGEIAKRGGRGAAAGAGIGWVFGGIGAFPGAVIGFIIFSLRSALKVDYSKDIKSNYCD